MPATQTGTHPAVQLEPDSAPDAAPDSSLAPRPLVVLLGPTASGKTGLAIQIARRFAGEIVSADSRQIYRYMDIGTAKPTPDQRRAALHHLIDVVEPDESFTLAQYQRAAYAAIDTIHARDHLPLLVGGTGQYITAILEGWGIPEVPPNPDLRTDLEDYAEQHGARALHARLRAADPAAADRIDYRNVRRVIRALEVYLETGTPITVLQSKTPPPYRVLPIGLTMPREMLYQRIDARVERMVEQGLCNEVRDLLHRGYTWECPAMSGLGYSQWRDHLDGAATIEDVTIAIQHATHAFARRQYTWFKGHDTGIRWLDITQTAPETARDWIADWLAHQGK